VILLQGLATCGTAITRKAIAIVTDFIQTRINDAVPATDHRDFGHFSGRFINRGGSIGENDSASIDGLWISIRVCVVSDVVNAALTSIRKEEDWEKETNGSMEHDDSREGTAVS
jgi:hypothetical protein